jgi:hypothetical protein
MEASFLVKAHFCLPFRQTGPKERLKKCRLHFWSQSQFQRATTWVGAGLVSAFTAAFAFCQTQSHPLLEPADGFLPLSGTDRAALLLKGPAYGAVFHYVHFTIKTNEIKYIATSKWSIRANRITFLWGAWLAPKSFRKSWSLVSAFPHTGEPGSSPANRPIKFGTMA